MKATQEEIDHYTKIALERGGSSKPSVAESVAQKPVLVQKSSRHKTGRMNKTEQKHARDLEDRKERGEITGYWFEAIKLRLNDRCFFTPDFFVRYVDGTMGFEECKGPFFWEDARVKLLTAARIFPMFSFRLYQTGKEMVVISGV